MYEQYGAEATFVSYTKLQQAASVDLLEQLRPDVLVLDEAHMLKRAKTNSAARRIYRYLASNPSVRVCALTGTVQSRSIMEWAHLALWALRRRAPVPQSWALIEALAERLDQDAEARATFLAKLENTPGLILDASADADYAGETPIFVHECEPELKLNAEWRLNDGYYLVGPAQAAAVEKMLAYGYWPRVEPRHGERYLEARAAWARIVRRVCEREAADTELQVRAIRPAEYEAWRAVEMTEPEGVQTAVWESDARLRAILADVQPGTIVWAHHVALQTRAAEILGAPHHGPKGLDAAGVRIDQATAPRIVASISACSAGFNLQAYNRHLVLEPPGDPSTWKQLIGRCARQGQAAPVVRTDVIINCQASKTALHQSIIRARLVLETTGKGNPLLQLEGQFQ